MEQQPAGGGDADCFGDDVARLGDVVDDAVADDDRERRRIEGQAAWHRRAAIVMRSVKLAAATFLRASASMLSAASTAVI